MTRKQRQGQTPAALEHADLEAILAAWNDATVRLAATHQALQAEVRRLTEELEEKNRQLARKNRLADLGQMASHIAHEVRNNLVPVTLYLSLLRRQIGENTAALETLDKIEAGFHALEVMVGDLLQFSADRDPQRQWLSVRELLGELSAAIGPQLRAQGIELEVNSTESLGLWGDRDMLRRALLNLVLNAIDAMPQGGRLRLSGRSTADAVELEVGDTGPGLSEEARRRAFEPFFTTKCNGTGLGLAIAYRIAEAHRGTISAANCSAGGAAFVMRIPLEQKEVAA